MQPWLNRWLIGVVGAIALMVFVLTQPPLTAQLPSETDLNIYNWTTYIDPAILDEFQQRYHVKLRYDTYEGMDELHAKLKAGHTGYDIVVPSDYMVETLVEEGFLAELDLEAIPNRKHIDPHFLNPAYDPGNRYSLPYQWGTLGIGYNLEATQRAITSWADMFNPQYAGRVAWLDDARYTISAILITMGKDPNSEKTSEIHQARDFLLQQKDTIATFTSAGGQDLLTQGEVDLTFEWSGDVLQVMKENPDLRYAIPKEGSIIWTDNIVILKDAPHPDRAKTFINFLLEPQISAKISNFTHYGSPNLTARQQQLISLSDANNPSIYPSPELLSKLQYLKKLKTATLQYEAAWKAVKSEVSNLESIPDAPFP
jgi:spermidine/putrescine transport system substrate-binding protein